MAESSEAPLHQRVRLRFKKRWRAWLRAIHRDAGYLAVGLTFVYALSGIAINHIEDWNPNFDAGDTVHDIGPVDEKDDEAATQVVLSRLSITDTPQEAYFATDTELEIYFETRSLKVDVDSGKVFDEYEEPRFFLRVANWLHYNRGKAAWTYIADGYAVFLLFLALSGLFMLKGRKGLLGRGAVLVLVGSLVPILYVHFSGGP